MKASELMIQVPETVWLGEVIRKMMKEELNI
jgi:hypothetical protein